MDNELFEKSKKSREKIEKLIDERNIEDIKKILSLKEGRRLLWRILCETKIFRSTMTGDNFTFFYEGEKSIGLFILKIIHKADMDAFLKMQKEADEEAKFLNEQIEASDKNERKN